MSDREKLILCNDCSRKLWKPLPNEAWECTVCRLDADIQYLKNRRVSQWVSVEEKLPLIHTQVYCWNEYICSPMIAEYIGGRKWQSRISRSIGFEKEITHWMPLLDPPEAPE